MILYIFGREFKKTNDIDNFQALGIISTLLHVEPLFPQMLHRHWDCCCFHRQSVIQCRYFSESLIFNAKKLILFHYIQLINCHELGLTDES